MNIRVMFGFLFFVLSVVFCAFQLITLHAAEHLEPVALVLQFVSASVCLLLASLAAQSGNKAATTAIAVVAFTMCFIALLIGGILAMKGAQGADPLKYVVFLAYGGLYGFFGLAFSLLSGRSVGDPAKKSG